ncbi:hypothetical protein PUN28_015398 [Cardiocondyla obscurior]|uniref:Uncharacterized protein n=1 Tax=Cardiocondyla obscurior TaxID=286306 RepID=A0AAW2EYU1_9HYME
MQVSTFKRIEMIIRDPPPSAFLEAIKAMIHSALFAKSCQHNGVSSHCIYISNLNTFTFSIKFFPKTKLSPSRSTCLK